MLPFRQFLQNLLTKTNPVKMQPLPTLVAVSKTNPKEAVIEVYRLGQRHFGENYVQELISKASDESVLASCPDICWHFIGNLQRNKVRRLLSCPRLWAVETVDSPKLADELNKECERIGRQDPLMIYVQVNTSGEENKGGCSPQDVGQTVRYILTECRRLAFAGLMTIGSVDHSTNEQRPNPDFKMLVNCRQQLASELGLSEAGIGLSMGMSQDFEHAIDMGSTNVRVGSLIFGART